MKCLSKVKDRLFQTYLFKMYHQINELNILSVYVLGYFLNFILKIKI